MNDKKINTKDIVFALRDGFYARVDGNIFGPWPMREYAVAGMQTEQRRVVKNEGLSEWKDRVDGDLSNVLGFDVRGL